jgi:UDP-N-acetylmuramoyl-L-alanyl-D-glutamate--2,6-diaminopimelate ligase
MASGASPRLSLLEFTRRKAMRLDELTAAELPGLRVLSPTPNWPEITALAYDSRRAQAGALFFCVSGYDHDGHDFAVQALAAGAVGLVVERPLELGVPELLVSSTRAAMGPLAARFYKEPSSNMRVVGVTGTNGKTTTSHLVCALLEAAGEPCGLLGTVESHVGAQRRAASRTTPEAIDLQADLRTMLDGGQHSCAMEVSSHALALGRTDCVRFAAAIFTNLTQDHLDFHETMEEYFQAKRRLFLPPAPQPKPGVSIVNLDDPYGLRLAGELDNVVTYAIDAEADYRARELTVEPGGTRLQLDTPSGTRSLSLGLPGRYNVANALGALAAVHALGGELDTLLAALERGVRVPGRLEPVEAGQNFAVLVDYAHTPDSLQNVLRTAHELGRGRVICVFGAGGDRDRGKRPLMGEVGAALADVLLVTSDNPRSEDPQEIVEQIMAGASAVKRPASAAPIVCELDRRAAIERAIELAERGDVLVIAGKGHEQGQEFAAGVKLPFDDVTVAREALAARGFHSAGVAA